MNKEADKPASSEPKRVQSNESKSTKEPGSTSCKKKSWKDWLLILVAVMTLGNGAAEITDMTRIREIARQQTEISRRLESGNPSPEQSKRHLLVSTEAQITAIKDSMVHNQAEIEMLDHYNRQLTPLSQTAIDIAHETISKRNPDDALTKAMKKKIERLESLLGPENQTG
jgi:hypothetical protein